MTASPLSLLEPFLSLYGIGVSGVSELSLDKDALHVTHYFEPTKVVREVTIRNWRDIPVTPPAPNAEAPAESESDTWCPHGLHRDLTCEHCDAEAADAALHYAG